MACRTTEKNTARHLPHFMPGGITSTSCAHAELLPIVVSLSRDKARQRCHADYIYHRIIVRHMTGFRHFLYFLRRFLGSLAAPPPVQFDGSRATLRDDKPIFFPRDSHVSHSPPDVFRRAIFRADVLIHDDIFRARCRVEAAYFLAQSSPNLCAGITTAGPARTSSFPAARAVISLCRQRNACRKYTSFRLLPVAALPSFFAGLDAGFDFLVGSMERLGRPSQVS